MARPESGNAIERIDEYRAPVLAQPYARGIDPAEVDYYDRFNGLWWDKQGPF